MSDSELSTATSSAVSAAGIAIALDGPDAEGVVVGVDAQVAVAAVGVGDGAFEHVDDLVLGEGVEAEERGAARRARVDGEERFSVVAPMSVMTPRSTSARRTSCWGAGEAVDLIEEEDGAAAIALEALSGEVADLADAGDAD